MYPVLVRDSGFPNLAFFISACTHFGISFTISNSPLSYYLCFSFLLDCHHSRYSSCLSSRVFSRLFNLYLISLICSLVANNPHFLQMKCFVLGSNFISTCACLAAHSGHSVNDANHQVIHKSFCQFSGTRSMSSSHKVSSPIENAAYQNLQL